MNEVTIKFHLAETQIHALFNQRPEAKKSMQKQHISTGSYIKLAAGVNDRVRPKRNCFSLNLFHIFFFVPFSSTFFFYFSYWKILHQLIGQICNVCKQRWTLQNFDDFYGVSQFHQILWIKLRMSLAFFSGKFFNIANSQRIDCKNKCEFCLPVRWTAKNCAQGNSKEITSEATVKRWILHSLTLHTEKECRRRLNWFRVESKYFEWSNAVDQQNRL